MRGHFKCETQTVFPVSQSGSPESVRVEKQDLTVWSSAWRGWREGQNQPWKQGSSGPKVYYTVRQEELQDRAMPS